MFYLYGYFDHGFLLRLNLRRSLFVLPNLFTLASLFCGFYAMVLCSEGLRRDGRSSDLLYRACLMVLCAMLFDTLDGRIARLTRTQSAFGVQIDSLCDLVSFGIAPAVLVHVWSLHALGTVGTLFAFGYVAGGAIRLARFNVVSVDAAGEVRRPGKYIHGLPIPIAAGIVVGLVIASYALDGQLAAWPWLTGGVLVGLSLLMVSNLAFRSFKEITPTPRSWVLVGTLAVVGIVLSRRYHIVVALLWLVGSYVVLGLVESMLRLSRRRRRDIAPAKAQL